jgi:hypothetical protein
VLSVSGLGAQATLHSRSVWRDKRVDRMVRREGLPARGLRAYEPAGLAVRGEGGPPRKEGGMRICRCGYGERMSIVIVAGADLFPASSTA